MWQTARSCARISRISGHAIPSLRDATAPNSLSTWTLITPPPEISSSARSAFAALPDSR